MITPPVLALLVSLGQLSVPFDLEAYYTSSCSTSQRTGYVPVVTKLTCSTHAGMDGCLATGRINLAEQLPHQIYGTAYRYMCDRQIWQGPVEIQDAEIELSGLKFDAQGAQQTFKQFRVRVESTHFDPVTYELDWRVVLNWKISPTAMVDLFTAEVFGEIVWTTNQDSQLVRGSGSCSAPGSSCGAVATQFTWPSGWLYGGTALTGVDVESLSTGANGILPTNISADFVEVVKTSGAKVAWLGTLDDGNTPAPGLSFVYSSLTIIGAPSEVFRAWVGPFAQGSNPPVAVGISVPFFKQAATRCGLRSFGAASNATPGGTTAMLWLGAHSVDCGWSPGDLYTASGFHGFQDYLNPGSERVEFSLDATRLP